MKQRPSTFSAKLPKASLCLSGLLCLLCVGLLGCSSLRGTECRDDSDCQSPLSCLKGWCKSPTESGLEPLLDTTPPDFTPPTDPKSCPTEDAFTLDPPKVFQKTNIGSISEAVSDGKHLYWLDEEWQQLVRQPVGSDKSEFLREDLPIYLESELRVRPSHLLVDQSYIYVSLYSETKQGPGKAVLLRLLKKAGDNKPLVLARDQIRIQKMVQDRNFLYWTTIDEDGENGAIMRLAKSGEGAPQKLADAHRPSALAIDGTHLYWASYSTDAKLMKMPLRGGAPVTLVENLSFPSDIAVDDDFVYYLQDGIWRHPKEGRFQPRRLSGHIEAPSRLVIGPWFAYTFSGKTTYQIPLRCSGTQFVYPTRTELPVHSIIVDGQFAFLFFSRDGIGINMIHKARLRPPQEWFSFSTP